MPKYLEQDQIDRLNNRINNLEFERQMLNQKIDNLKQELQSDIQKSDQLNDMESKKELLSQMENNDELQTIIKDLEKQAQSEISDKSYDNLKTSAGSPGFGMSANLGGTIPILQDGFSMGYNVCIRLETPISFALAGREIKVGTEIYSSNMLPDNGGPWNYSLTNIVCNLSIFPISSINIRTGLGYTLASIGTTKKNSLSIPVDIIYYFPKDLSGFKFGINLMSQVTFGHPIKEGMTSLINIGLVIKTPL